MKSINLFLALFFSFSLIAQTPDGYTHTNQEEVPKAVKESFMQMFPQSDEVEWSSFRNEFQAKHNHNNHVVYSRFNNEGLHRNDLTQMNWEKEADDNLKNSLNRTYYKNWEVIEFYEKQSNKGDITYTIQLRNEDNELGTIYFDSEGKLDKKSKSAY